MSGIIKFVDKTTIRLNLLLLLLLLLMLVLVAGGGGVGGLMEGVRVAMRVLLLGEVVVVGVEECRGEEFGG